MHKKLLKWRRDRAVYRLIKNGQELRKAQHDLAFYGYEYPDWYVTDERIKIERLKRAIETDTDFIRTTAPEATNVQA